MAKEQAKGSLSKTAKTSKEKTTNKRSKEEGTSAEVEEMPKRKRKSRDEARKDWVPDLPPYDMLAHLCGSGKRVHYTMYEDEVKRHACQQKLIGTVVCDILKVKI